MIGEETDPLSLNQVERVGEENFDAGDNTGRRLRGGRCLRDRAHECEKENFAEDEHQAILCALLDMNNIPR